MHKKMMKQEIKNDDLDHERGTEKKVFFSHGHGCLFFLNFFCDLNVFKMPQTNQFSLISRVFLKQVNYLLVD